MIALHTPRHERAAEATQKRASRATLWCARTDAQSRSLAGAPTLPIDLAVNHLLVALEEALEPMLESVCAAAFSHAEKKGRANIELEDLKAVSVSFMKGAK